MNHRLLRILLAFIPALLGAFFFYRQVQSTRVNEAASSSDEVRTEAPAPASGGLDAGHDSLVKQLRDSLLRCHGRERGVGRDTSRRHFESCLHKLLPEIGLTDFRPEVIGAGDGWFHFMMKQLDKPERGFYYVTGTYILWYDLWEKKFRWADGNFGELPRVAVPL